MTVRPAFDFELEQLVLRAFDEIPIAFREQISNLGFVIEDEPPPGKPWLASYHGQPLTKQSALQPWAWPRKITFYSGPIKRLCGNDPRRLENELRRLVRHEVAHYFGISDERLVEIGRY